MFIYCSKCFNGHVLRKLATRLLLQLEEYIDKVSRSPTVLKCPTHDAPLKMRKLFTKNTTFTSKKTQEQSRTYNTCKRLLCSCIYSIVCEFQRSSPKHYLNSLLTLIILYKSEGASLNIMQGKSEKHHLLLNKFGTRN